MKILIMGLPGSGKTWLSDQLQTNLGSALFDSYDVRIMADDMDYSKDGRLRHTHRLASIANFEASQGRKVIINCVCPRINMRSIIDPDVLIWMATIENSRDPATDRMFQQLTENETHQRIIIRRKLDVSAAARIAQRIEQRRWDKV